MESVLEAKRISYRYTNFYQIKDLSIKFHKGEIVSIIGPNGSGKSTMMRLLTRLLTPAEGTVFLDGKAIHQLDRKTISQTMTMLPQIQDHSLDMTVRDLVSYGRAPYLKWYENAGSAQSSFVDWAIEGTKLTNLQHRSLHTLSGGERQRAWIAMCIAQTPSILLLDEPTSFLDIAHQLEIMELVKELNHTLGITIIMVLHDLNQAARYSDKIIAMKDGKVVREGSPAEVYTRDFFREVFSVEANVHMDGEKPVFDPYGLVKKMNQ